MGWTLPPSLFTPKMPVWLTECSSIYLLQPFIPAKITTNASVVRHIAMCSMCVRSLYEQGPSKTRPSLEEELALGWRKLVQEWRQLLHSLGERSLWYTNCTTYTTQLMFHFNLLWTWPLYKGARLCFYELAWILCLFDSDCWLRVPMFSDKIV